MIVEFRYRFEAAHRFLNSDSRPCMTPHGHSWYTTLALEFVGPHLNRSGMTVEFSQIKADWKAMVQNTLDHSYLHNVNDPIVEVLKTQADCEPRLLPFPGDPTTEVIAVFLFHKMNLILENSEHKDLVKVHALHLEETPTNKITCLRPFYESEIKRYSNYDGWWNKADIMDRSFHAD